MALRDLAELEVKNRLLELKELGPNEKAAEQRVFAGGLKVGGKAPHTPHYGVSG